MKFSYETMVCKISTGVRLDSRIKSENDEGGRSFDLDGITIQTDNPFAIIYVTGLEKGKSIDESKSLLITTIARARNTGMEYEYLEDQTILKSVGTAPLLVEPVMVNITFNYKDLKVNVLDHDGLRTNKTVPVKNGKVKLDGRKHKAIWYEVVK